MKRIGYVHIPKCGGSAFSDGIESALNLSKTHISVIVDKETTKLWSLKRSSIAYKFASNSIYLHGHISYKEMVLLKRDVVFTVLRDPVARVISAYTYNLNRASNPISLKNDPTLKRYRDMSFIDFLKIVKPNGIFRNLVGDVLKKNQLGFYCSRYNPDLLLDLNFTNSILDALRRFDYIFDSDLSRAASVLSEDNITPAFKVHRLNISKQVEINIGGSRGELEEALLHHTWIDDFVYRSAMDLFPHYVTKKPMLISDAYDSIAKNFNIID
ncbi:Sulfotransferase family protein [Amphritea atlantica]|uniref:Sulfotransferase family protein n=1 Tax=Amphritea atlantica TaxID=355243 RepID=A0A1H9K8Y9_9GAMM|nr:sulfotransferase family 2 domain-containing protein [Amphritea atlantica]SEQ95528.1 Sulfotransferase family protein [Amphritea atlantica]